MNQSGIQIENDSRFIHFNLRNQFDRSILHFRDEVEPEFA